MSSFNIFPLYPFCIESNIQQIFKNHAQQTFCFVGPALYLRNKKEKSGAPG